MNFFLACISKMKHQLLMFGILVILFSQSQQSTVVDTPSCFFLDFDHTLQTQTAMRCDSTEGCTKGSCNDAGCMLTKNGYDKQTPGTEKGGCLAANVYEWTGFSASMDNTNPFARIDINGQATYFGFALDYGLMLNPNQSLVEIIPSSTNQSGSKLSAVLNNRNIGPKDPQQGSKGHRGFYTTLNKKNPDANLAALDEETCTVPLPPTSGSPPLEKMHMYWAGQTSSDLEMNGQGAKPRLDLHNFVLLGNNTGDTTTIRFTTNVKDVKCGANFALYLATTGVTDPWGNLDPQNFYNNPGFPGTYGCSAQMFYGDANADRTNCFTYAFEFDLFEANNEGVHTSSHGALPDMEVPTKFIKKDNVGYPTGWDISNTARALQVTSHDYKQLGQVKANDGELGYYYSRQMTARDHQKDFVDCGPSVTSNLPSDVVNNTFKCYRQKTGRANKRMWYGHVERVPGSSYGHTFPVKNNKELNTPYPHNRIVDSYGVVIGNAGQGVLKNFGPNAYGKGSTNTIDTNHDYDVKIDLVTGENATEGDWSFTLTLIQGKKNISATVTTSDVSNEPIVFQGTGYHTSSLLCYKGAQYVMIDRIQYIFTTTPEPGTNPVEVDCSEDLTGVQIKDDDNLKRESVVKISTKCVKPAGEAFPGIVKDKWGNGLPCEAQIFNCSTLCNQLSDDFIYVKNQQGDPTGMDINLKQQSHRELGKMLQTNGMILTSSYWAQPMNAFPLFCDNLDCLNASATNLLTLQTVTLATNLQNASHPDNGYHEFEYSDNSCLNALMLILQSYDSSAASHTFLGTHDSGLFKGTNDPDYDSVLNTVQNKLGGVTVSNGMLSASSSKLGSLAEVLCFGVNDTFPAFNYPSQVFASHFQAGIATSNGYYPGGFDGFAGADTTWLNGWCNHYQPRDDNTAALGYYENLAIDYNWKQSDPASGATPVENRYCDGAFSACVVNEGNTTGNFTDAIRECANDPAINSTLCDGLCVAPTWVPPPPPPYPPGQAPPSPALQCPNEAAERPKACQTSQSAKACWNKGCYFGCDYKTNALKCVNYPTLPIQITGPPFNFSRCGVPEPSC